MVGIKSESGTNERDASWRQAMEAFVEIAPWATAFGPLEDSRNSSMDKKNAAVSLLASPLPEHDIADTAALSRVLHFLAITLSASTSCLSISAVDDTNHGPSINIDFVSKTSRVKSFHR